MKDIYFEHMNGVKYAVDVSSGSDSPTAEPFLCSTIQPQLSKPQTESCMIACTKFNGNPSSN